MKDAATSFPATAACSTASTRCCSRRRSSTSSSWRGLQSARSTARSRILGFTGSIGTSALAVVDAHPDRLQVVGLAAGDNVAGASPAQVAQVRARARWRWRSEQRPAGAAHALDRPCPPRSRRAAREGLVAVATHPDVDVVLCASSGTAALEAVLAAIEARQDHRARQQGSAGDGRRAGDGGGAAARCRRSARRQRAQRHPPVPARARAGEVRRLILTASGGPFRGRSRDEPRRRHRRGRAEAPDLADGPEDHHRLGHADEQGARGHRGALAVRRCRPSQIDVVIHPQSVVHSMVELTDGSVIAQLGVTDMRLPIQYAFSYPERWDAPVPFLDFARWARSTFESPARDASRASAWPIARSRPAEPAHRAERGQRGRRGVFSRGTLPFTAIPELIARTMDAHAGRHRRRDDAGRGGRAGVDAWARDARRRAASARPGRYE